MSAETAPVTDISGAAAGTAAATPKKPQPQQAKRIDVAPAASAESKRLPPKETASAWPGMPSMDVTKFFEDSRERLKDAFEQASGKLDSFRDVARDASDVCQEAHVATLTGLKDINEHLYELVQSEVDRGYDFLRAATHAKGVSELVQLQSDYMRDTMETHLEQAKMFTELTSSLFKAAYSPLQQGFATVIENARKRS